jgi:hypothetical protein
MRNIFIILLWLLQSCATNKTYQSRPIGTDSIPQGQLGTALPSAPFHTELKTQWVNDLVRVANCTFTHADFLKAVESKTLFDYSEHTGADVIGRMSKITCGIRLYSTKNPFSSAIATTYASDRSFLYLNTRKNPREMKYMVNTVIHECSHLAGYTHGDNSPVGKENSVPYWIGDKAEEVAVKCME